MGSVPGRSAAMLLLILACTDLSGGATVWAGAVIHFVLGLLMIRDQFAHVSG